jgi:hypothetical protein
MGLYQMIPYLILFSLTLGYQEYPYHCEGGILHVEYDLVYPLHTDYVIREINMDKSRTKGQYYRKVVFCGNRIIGQEFFDKQGNRHDEMWTPAVFIYHYDENDRISTVITLNDKLEPSKNPSTGAVKICYFYDEFDRIKLVVYLDEHLNVIKHIKNIDFTIGIQNILYDGNNIIRYNRDENMNLIFKETLQRPPSPSGLYPDFIMRDF